MKITSTDRRLQAIAMLVLTLCAAGPAAADVTFNVNTGADLIDDNTNDGVCHTSSNTCSLRAAVMQANHWSNAESAYINLPAGTYQLSIPIPANGFDGEAAGDLNLTTPLVLGQRIIINGAGAATTIIDGGQIDRVIAVGDGRGARIAGVTVRNGRSFFSGGGVLNVGELTIANCVLDSNHANGAGGGIYNDGTLLMLASTLHANTADSGGGIYVFGPAIIRDSTLYANGANYGGGAYNNGQMYVVNSTFGQNYAYTDGGGIFSRITAAIYNVTLVDNDADHDHDENGGIGGGVYADPGSRFIVVHSLIAGNTQFNAPIYNDCSGALETYGRNFFGEVASCTFPNTTTWGGVLLNTIGPLQNNGGPTLTHALLPTSQAINTTTDPFGCVDETGAPLLTDQRGAPRTVGSHCDAGAYEFGAIVPSPLLFANSFE